VLVLPAAAVQLLQFVLAQMAGGNAVTLLPVHAELTTQEAADLLGVSRPYLVKQLERHVLPYRTVGTHRRVLLSDLLAYQQKVRRQQNQALQDLADESQDMDLGT